MRRTAVWMSVLAALAVVVAPSAAKPATTWTHGYDVSWPQCAGPASAQPRHLPGGRPRFVVLGLTHGRGNTANPCLDGQVAWARRSGVAIGVYLVPSYPTPAERAAMHPRACSSRRCRLAAAGAAQARDALATMRQAGLAVPMVWVDVEVRSHPGWSRQAGHNRALLRGVLRGLRAAGVRAGIYTTGYQWGRITGGWRVDVPNWLPSGDGNPASARRQCATSATGGATWLAQFTREWDEDLTCPAMDARRGRPGPLWRYRHTTLSLGSTGRAVSAAQHAVGVRRTGSYDLATVLAVSSYQREHGLPVTGSVDTDDWRALGAFRRIGGHPFLLRRMTTT